MAGHCKYRYYIIKLPELSRYSNLWFFGNFAGIYRNAGNFIISQFDRKIGRIFVNKTKRTWLKSKGFHKVTKGTKEIKIDYKHFVILVRNN